MNNYKSYIIAMIICISFSNCSNDSADNRSLFVGDWNVSETRISAVDGNQVGELNSEFELKFEDSGIGLLSADFQQFDRSFEWIYQEDPEKLLIRLNSDDTNGFILFEETDLFSINQIDENQVQCESSKNDFVSTVDTILFGTVNKEWILSR